MKCTICDQNFAEVTTHLMRHHEILDGNARIIIAAAYDNPYLENEFIIKRLKSGNIVSQRLSQRSDIKRLITNAYTTVRKIRIDLREKQRLGKLPPDPSHDLNEKTYFKALSLHMSFMDYVLSDKYKSEDALTTEENEEQLPRPVRSSTPDKIDETKKSNAVQQTPTSAKTLSAHELELWLRDCTFVVDGRCIIPSNIHLDNGTIHLRTDISESTVKKLENTEQKSSNHHILANTKENNVSRQHSTQKQKAQSLNRNRCQVSVPVTRLQDSAPSKNARKIVSCTKLTRPDSSAQTTKFDVGTKSSRPDSSAQTTKFDVGTKSSRPDSSVQISKFEVRTKRSRPDNSAQINSFDDHWKTDKLSHSVPPKKSKTSAVENASHGSDRDMDNSSGSSKVKSRRTWSPYEEHLLISSIKYMAKEGYRPCWADLSLFVFFSKFTGQQIRGKYISLIKKGAFL